MRWYIANWRLCNAIGWCGGDAGTAFLCVSGVGDGDVDEANVGDDETDGTR